ncbi:MAG: potassium-transporting ATPase subunit KdpA [Acidimicrobiales bacterium]
MALAGALARGRVRPATSGTLPTSGITFGIVFLGVVALVGGLTFLPACLGPLAEAI